MDDAVWPETMIEKRNQLAKAYHNDIISKLPVNQIIDSDYHPFGGRHTAEKYVK